MKDLKVIHDDNGSFVDFSKKAKTYIQDSFQIQFVSAEDSFYLGLYKPFFAIYPQIDTITSSTSLLEVQYYNGSSFTAVTLIEEETDTLNRGGLITWEKPSDWTASSINGEELYWIKLDIADCDLTFAGLNVLFSSDADLKKEQYDIELHLPKNANSFAHYHEAARDEIVQRMRNSGKATYSSQIFNDFAKWDFLDVSQIRQASKFLVLAKVMFDASTEIDDKYYQKHRDYMDMFGEAFKLYFLSWDKDNDGEVDTNERMGIRTSEFIKV